MKNKGIILLLALAGLFSTISCNDAIDIRQDGEVSDPYDVFRNAKDVKRGVSGIYNSLPGESEVEFVSVFTDEVAIGLENGGQGLIGGEYGFYMDRGNAFASSTWGSYYSVINRINRLIEVSDKLIIELPQQASELKDQQAELYALRAYANYKLFAYFTPDYSNPSGYSIIKLDRVPSKELNETLGRSTVAEIKSFILSDLEKAESLRSSGWSTVDYVTPGFINAVRVKLFAMTGDSSEVLTYGEAILNRADMQLANASQYTQLFPRSEMAPTDDVNIGKEIIFKLKRTINGGGAVAGAWYSIEVSGDGSYFYEMGRSLYNQLDGLDSDKTGTAYGDRNDVRYNVNLDAQTEVATNYASLSAADYRNNDILLIGKYQGKQGARLQNDIMIFRSSDILLAMAEARAAQGNLTAASTDPDDLVGDYTSVQSILFNLRFNRWTGAATDIVLPNVSTQQAAYKAILDERRVELAFEGQRYLDMKRLGKKAGSPGFERYSKDCAVNGACNLPINDHRMTLPIPNSEINANPVIKGQQNPGY